jgi:cell fate regulator YaaT (PSP1 superfamily)
MELEANEKKWFTRRGCNCSWKNQLNVYDWLSGLPDSEKLTDYVEVQFKNTRKGYYQNSNGLQLEKGDMVAVEASSGHDIGEVSLTGELVLWQMRKCGYRFDNQNSKRIYRKVRLVDMEKYYESKAKEHETMLKARKIAEDLKLEMKIGDVEYQGDGNKAIFYYIANDRVDFRQLIKILAETFHVRIEMKQIGARQEAGRIGGIGPCGRALCCSSWMTSFVSVTTGAARYQDISLNPQKLAGQCAKLKCCLNYEVEAYVESQKKLPSREIPLETQDGIFYHFKTDILKQLLTYSSDKNFAANLVTLPAKRVFDVINMNKAGHKPKSLLEDENKGKNVTDNKKETFFQNVVGQDSVTRFDKGNRKKNSGNRRDNFRKNKNQNQGKK